MVDIWTIAITIAGAVGIGVIADRIIAGGAGLQIAITVIGEILDAIKTTVSFLLDNMPRPIKMAIFLVLFVSLGGLIYNYTIGAQYVCLEDDVYHVSITEGLAINFWPPALERDSERDERLRNQVDIDENISAVGTGDTYWRVTRQSRLFSSNEYVDPSELTDKDILYNKENVVIQGDEGENIAMEEVVYATTSFGDIINEVWLEAIFRSSGDVSDFFNAWMGGDQQATYQVCRDPATNTCRLARLDVSSWGDFFGYSFGIREEFADGCEGGLTGTNEPGLYGEVVGSISYSVNDEGTLTGAYTDSSNIIGGIVDSITRGNIEDVCLNADDDDFQFDAATYDELIGSESSPIQPQDVKIYKAGLFDSGTSVVIPIYGATRVPILADIESGYVFADKTNPDPGANVHFGENTVEDLFESPELVEEEQGQIVTFSCNQNTPDNEYDTRMYLGGIDIFDPKLMVLFVLLSFIWAFYKSMNVF